MLRALGTALLCLAALAPTRVGADARTIVVQQGDVLGAIAKREGVTVAELKTWNALVGDRIRTGQRLVVRSKRPRNGVDETLGGLRRRNRLDATFRLPRRATKHDRRPVTAPVAARDSSTAVAAKATNRSSSRKRGRTYTVRRGDTLLGIALRHDTTVEELKKANPGLDPHRIFPGQTIEVGLPRPEVVFRLERGRQSWPPSQAATASLQRDILRWNQRLGSQSPRPGTAIRIYTRASVSASEAIGPTNRGRLENPEQLPRHRGYVIRTPARAYGTEETIRWLVDAFDAVDRKFRYTKVVRIHDISDRDGGRLRDHKSHQNGRDADISYYQTKCGVNGCAFSEFRSSELDVARQWALLEHWLRRGQAEMIFIDYRLQAKLYKYARRKGISKAKLNEWIQYPRGRYEPQGVIRHFPNHEDHLHVRFACPYSDLKCRP